MWYLIVSIPDLCTLTYFLHVPKSLGCNASHNTDPSLTFSIFQFYYCLNGHILMDLLENAYQHIYESINIVLIYVWRQFPKKVLNIEIDYKTQNLL